MPPKPATRQTPRRHDTDQATTDPPATATRPPARRRFPLRENQKAQTRQRLIDAAIACFTAKGFDQTTPGEIALAADTTRSTFYLHFKSTAELALCVGHSLADESIALIQTLDQQPAPTPQTIRAWLGKIVALYKARLPVVTALNRALSSSPEWESHYADFAEFYPRGMTRYLSRYEGAQREEARRRLFLVYMLVERFLYFEVLVQTPVCSQGMDRTLAEGIHRLLYADRPEHAARSKTNTPT